MERSLSSDRVTIGTAMGKRMACTWNGKLIKLMMETVPHNLIDIRDYFTGEENICF